MTQTVEANCPTDLSIRDKQAAFRTHSPEETQEIGVKIGCQLNPGDVVALIGDLGVGKTCLTQGIARGAASIKTKPSTAPPTSSSTSMREKSQFTISISIGFSGWKILSPLGWRSIWTEMVSVSSNGRIGWVNCYPKATFRSESLERTSSRAKLKWCLSVPIRSDISVCRMGEG